MASINSLAKEYADYIRLNKENPNAISEIASRINGLIFTESQKHLSDSDKERLIDEIKNNLSHKKETEDGFLIIEAEDSSELVKLIQMLRSQTTGK